MVNHDGYDIVSQPISTAEERRQTWDVAIGLNQVDDLTPSQYLRELAEKSIDARISYQEIETELRHYYEKQDVKNPQISDTRECDIVSTRIAQLLEDPTFVFSPIYLKTIHAHLFKGVWPEFEKYAGTFRDYNITKKEPILEGRTVVYGDFANIMEYLKYDFDNESGADYAVLSSDQQVKRLAKFTSAIWQVHPFREGNTRTTAVFIEKYLRSNGFDVNNDLFSNYAKYFRNALVLSNYGNMREGIHPNDKYLLAFFEKLLVDPLCSLPRLETPVKAKMINRIAAAQDEAQHQQRRHSDKQQPPER